MKIMAIDDFDLLSRQVKLILEGAFDCKVLSFSNTHSALEHFRSNCCFDFVVTDLLMPSMNGVEFAGEILKISREHQNGIHNPPKIILITAVATNTSQKTPDQELLDLAVSSGYFDEVLHKPIVRQKLLKCFSGLISANVK